LTDNDLEFVEIGNPTNEAIDLTDWRIRGEADFDFVAGTSLAAGSTIVVVPFDLTIEPNKLAAFQAHYDLTSNVNLVGGLSESLSNSSGRISLQQPDAFDGLLIPHVVVDEVVYDDLAPWDDADGNGQSLNRIDFESNGNFANSWEAGTPSPVADLPLEFEIGDVDRNGIINILDISPFINVLSTGGFQFEADTNQDGIVNILDIGPFIALLNPSPD